MSKTNKKTKREAPERMENCRGAFDFIVSKSIDVIKRGGSVASEFSAIAFMPYEKTFEIIPIPLNDTVDAEQRREVMAYVGEDLATYGAEVYIFMAVAEAWFAKRSRGQKYVRPSTSPTRKEVFIATAEDKNGKVRNISYEIQRNGKDITLKKIALFGKKEEKLMLDWISMKEIGKDKGHSLTHVAWEAYKKKLKEVNQ